MKSISLIGFMGAGKTVVGKALAASLNLPYLDLDEEIERIEGKSVYRIFADEGESYFRRREWEVLQSLEEGDLILSVGGGAYTIDDNINLINERSHSVWLTCDINICIERCAATAAQRPLFNDPVEFAKLYKHRQQYYKRAHFHVDSNSDSPQQIAEKIIETIGLK